MRIVRDWSKNRKGRLYFMRQGKARALNSDAVIDFGPLKNLKGFPDLFGFEFKEVSIYEDYQYKTIKVPVFCVVEVKTPGDKVRPHQVDFLDSAVKFGTHAYLAMADDITDDGYILRRWADYKRLYL